MVDFQELVRAEGCPHALRRGEALIDNYCNECACEHLEEGCFVRGHWSSRDFDAYDDFGSDMLIKLEALCPG